MPENGRHSRLLSTSSTVSESGVGLDNIANAKSSMIEIPHIASRTIPGILSKHNKKALDWGPHGLLAYGCNFVVVIVDPAAVQHIQCLNKHKAAVTRVKWQNNRKCTSLTNPSRMLLASCDSLGNILVWDAHSISPVMAMQDGNKPILALEWVPHFDETENLIAALHPPYSVVVWDALSGNKIWKKSYTEQLIGMDFDPFSAARLASRPGVVLHRDHCGGDKNTKVWCSKAGQGQEREEYIKNPAGQPRDSQEEIDKWEKVKQETELLLQENWIADLRNKIEEENSAEADSKIERKLEKLREESEHSDNFKATLNRQIEKAQAILQPAFNDENLDAESEEEMRNLFVARERLDELIFVAKLEMEQLNESAIVKTREKEIVQACGKGEKRGETERGAAREIQPHELLKMAERNFGNCESEPHLDGSSDGTVKALARALGDVALRPQIEIQRFEGDTTEFQPFLQMLQELTQTINSDIQRFVLLKSYLRGEPLTLISNINMDNGAYKMALSILKEEYGSPHKIIRDLTGRLKEVPTVKMNAAKELRDLSNRIDSIARTLRENGMRADLESILLMDLVKTKIPMPLQTKWNQMQRENRTPRAPSTLESFAMFLRYILMDWRESVNEPEKEKKQSAPTNKEFRTNQAKRGQKREDANFVK
ncbi:unnamed protein product [Notodromas monacha]|uniref:WDR11 first beta-propeller domain-containing protein n=1 Tax=Notodromas monacha TaxID=399045 RepID=A0A7R9G9Q3_9CRUS|nr:unnamed protein product [Notodromas monacha]CAG0912849.1 unnamed protein product [Notodromas monacha]